MAGMRVVPKLTLKQQMSRNPAFKGRPLTLEYRTGGGNLLRALDVVGKSPQALRKLALKIDGLRMPQITIPEMFDVNDNVRIIRPEVTVGLFKRVIEGCEITGHNAKKLRSILADPARESEALTYVSLLDARKFAERLGSLTDRKFRVQTKAVNFCFCFCQSLKDFFAFFFYRFV